jgi:hypothetical protein
MFMSDGLHPRSRLSNIFKVQSVFSGMAVFAGIGKNPIRGHFSGLHHYSEVLEWFFTAVEAGGFEMP